MKERKRGKKPFTEQEIIERYKSILENIEDGYCELDIAGNIILFNDALCRVLGYSAEDLTGMNYKRYVSPEDMQRVYEFYHDLYLTGTPGKLVDYKVITKDGSRRVIEASVSLIRDSAGKPIRFRSFSRDITERKRSEEELRESEGRYRSILENIEDGYFELDLAGNMAFFNTSMCRIANVSASELLGMNYREYTRPETAKELFRVFNKIYRTGDPLKSADYEILWKDGTRRTLDLSVALIRDQEGNPSGFRGIARDVTERKTWEENLRKSEEKYRLILKNIQEGYFEVDLKGKLVFFNDTLCNLAGYSRDELLNMNMRDYLTAESVKTLLKVFGAIYQTGNPSGIVDYEVITKEGNIVCAELSASLIRDEKGKPAGFRGLARDTTDRKLNERVLRESEEKYRTILDAIEEGYFEVDLAGSFTFVNNYLLKIAAATRDELIGMNYLRYTAPETAGDMYSVFNEVYRTGQSVKIKDFEIIRMDGTKRICELSVTLMHDAEGKPSGFRGIARDVTGRKQAERMYQTAADKSFAGIFIIQNGVFRYMNAHTVAYTGYTPEELIGKETMKIVHPDDRETLKRHALEMLKGIRKSSYEYRIITKDGDVRWIIETLTPVIIEGQRALLGNSMDITEQKKAGETLEKSFANLRKSLGATVQAIAMAVETRDPYTAGHQRRVADLARSIATEMGLASDQIEGIRLASTLHDLGKISIPAEILSKPTKLTNIEFDLIKTHPQSGYDILRDIEFPWPIARIVLEHHERIDGSGYPNGLTGDHLLIESRILAVADVVEAIASHRPYRPAHGISIALDEMIKNRGVLYDSDVTDACLRLFKEKNYALRNV